jgi:hypothetical protein
MRSVETKTEMQLDMQTLHWPRDRLVAGARIETSAAVLLPSIATTHTFLLSYFPIHRIGTAVQDPVVEIPADGAPVRPPTGVDGP